MKTPSWPVLAPESCTRTGNNLRDHMTDLELMFTMLGEASTTEIARRSDALG